MNKIDEILEKFMLAIRHLSWRDDINPCMKVFQENEKYTITQAKQEILEIVLWVLPCKKTFEDSKSARTSLRRHGYNEALRDTEKKLREVFG